MGHKKSKRKEAQSLGRSSDAPLGNRPAENARIATPGNLGDTNWQGSESAGDFLGLNQELSPGAQPAPLSSAVSNPSNPSGPAPTVQPGDAPSNSEPSWLFETSEPPVDVNIAPPPAAEEPPIAVPDVEFREPERPVTRARPLLFKCVAAAIVGMLGFAGYKTFLVSKEAGPDEVRSLALDHDALKKPVLEKPDAAPLAPTKGSDDSVAQKDNTSHASLVASTDAPSESTNDGSAVGTSDPNGWISPTPPRTDVPVRFEPDVEKSGPADDEPETNDDEETDGESTSSSLWFERDSRAWRDETNGNGDSANPVTVPSVEVAPVAQSEIAPQGTAKDANSSAPVAPPIPPSSSGATPTDVPPAARVESTPNPPSASVEATPRVEPVVPAAPAANSARTETVVANESAPHIDPKANAESTTKPASAIVPPTAPDAKPTAGVAANTTEPQTAPPTPSTAGAAPKSEPVVVVSPTPAPANDASASTHAVQPAPSVLPVAQAPVATTDAVAKSVDVAKSEVVALVDRAAKGEPSAKSDGAVPPPAKPAPAPAIDDGLRKASANDLVNVWSKDTIPFDAIGLNSKLLTPNVGRVRVVLQENQIFDGVLYSVGSNQVTLNTDLGRVALPGARVQKIERIAVTKALAANGKEASPQGESIRIRTPGGVVKGKIVSRDAQKSVILTDDGVRVSFDTKDIEIVANGPKIESKP